MKSIIEVVRGKGSKEYVLGKVEGYETLVLLTELEFSKKYRGDKRNIQVGLSYANVDKDFLTGYEMIVVEPYDKNDFIAFMSDNTFLTNFLKGKNQKMYVVLDDLNITIQSNSKLKKDSRKENGLDIDRFILK